MRAETSKPDPNVEVSYVATTPLYHHITINITDSGTYNGAFMRHFFFLELCLLVGQWRRYLGVKAFVKIGNIVPCELDHL